MKTTCLISCLAFLATAWAANPDVGAVVDAHGARIVREGVKYRGVFINDEDWGLRPWAVRHFGKEEQIGVRAYEEVFKIMKADGLNLLWPAMHEGGYEFSERPGNLDLATKNGITVGTSHCEPMLRNNCYVPKRDQKLWSWLNHRDFVADYWREGVKRGEGHNVLWTIGMRGIHDGRMTDGKTTEEKVAVLEDVFKFQTSLLASDAPKLFVPYKEVLPLYNAGLKVPGGTTIMWVNDNFGYIRRLGGPQAEGYGGGIYWHASYWGRPHGYIHLCTTPPAFMWYELCAKAWNNGVRDVWMLNAGDVFQAEALLFCYGQFAANPDAFGPDAQRRALSRWCIQTFSSFKNEMLHERIVGHLEDYYNLGFIRKPEFMCIQWTTNLPASVKAHLVNRYRAHLVRDAEIESELARISPESVDAYFRTVGFQSRFLANAGLVHLEGRTKEEARAVLDPLYVRWDALDGGKWSGFWVDTIEERTGQYQPTPHNRWSSQMQWPWNEPPDPQARDRHGVSRADYIATAYRADVPEPTWLEPVANEAANGGAWTRVGGLGTSGSAHALLPVKPGVGEGATMEFSLTGLRTADFGRKKSPGVRSQKSEVLVLQFLPDFALWPGLGLGVEVAFDGEKPQYVPVPKSDSNIGERDPVRNAAVQDNFIRVEVSIPDGAKHVEIRAVDPGVVVDRVGVRTRSDR